MDDQSRTKPNYIMRLTTTLLTDRYPQPITYNFENQSLKKLENRINIPNMSFLSPPEIPAFMAPYEKFFANKNPNFFQENFERRLDKDNQEELRQLCMPKPLKKSRFCGLCVLYYEEYYEHITSNSHKAKFTDHPFLPQLYDEMTQIHNDFIKERTQYIKTSTGKSSYVSPKEKENSFKEKGLSLLPKKMNRITHNYEKEIQNISHHIYSNTKTAKKELQQCQKTTKRKNLKAVMPSSKTQFSEGCTILNKENELGSAIHQDDTRHSEGISDRETSELVASLIKKDESLFDSSKNPSQRVFMKLKDQKRTLEGSCVKPNSGLFAIKEIEQKSCSKEGGEFFNYLEWIPHNLEEPKNSRATKTIFLDERDDTDPRFQRRYPRKNLKRGYAGGTCSSEEDIIFSFKKVKISDSQTQSQTTESESDRLDFNYVPIDIWQNFKNSFLEIFEDLKGTVNRIYDRWKKKDY